MLRQVIDTGMRRREPFFGLDEAFVDPRAPESARFQNLKFNSSMQCANGQRLGIGQSLRGHS